MKQFDDIQKIGQQNLDFGMKSWGEWAKGWQAITAEMTDYTKRSFEDSTQTFEKLIGSRSMEQAMEIQANYAKRAYEDYVAQMTRVSNIYTEMAREAYKPFEKVMGQR